MGRTIIFLFSLGILAFGIFKLLSEENKTPTLSTTKPPKEVIAPTKQIDLAASFAIFTNGTFRIFTDPKYHNASSDVFIQKENPNVIIVKKENITWSDFFKTLPMKLTKECLTTGTGQEFCNSNIKTLKFYINGKMDPYALDKAISRGDKLLVSYGSEDESQIKSQINKIPDN